MSYKFLSIIDVSEISAATGIGNILEAKLARFNDVILVLRMEDEDMVSLRNLSRIADYFSVSQEDVILNFNKNHLEVNVMGQEIFTYEDEVEVQDNDVIESVKCCGIGGCVGCPSAKG